MRIDEIKQTITVDELRSNKVKLEEVLREFIDNNIQTFQFENDTVIKKITVELDDIPFLGNNPPHKQMKRAINVTTKIQL